MKRILITGGAGYVGAVLVPKLLECGHQIKVLDLMMYGEDVFNGISDRQNFEVVKGDIRNKDLLEESLKNIDIVIHLACISNDPSFDLNPSLGRSINLDAFRPLVEISKKAGIQRFIYASSSSVYGIKDEPHVHEGMSLEPLTDYSKFKAECEDILSEYSSDDFTTVTIRPATVCGYSPRQRLDVIVNILSNHAYHNRKIKVFGGEQKRPNINIKDMTDLYVSLIDMDKEKINNKIFNAGYENHTVNQLGNLVKEIYGDDVEIVKEATDDNRSYHISCEKIKEELGFVPKYSIEDAALQLKEAFEDGRLKDTFENKAYFNIKTMLNNELK